MRIACLFNDTTCLPVYAAVRTFGNKYLFSATFFAITIHYLLRRTFKTSFYFNFTNLYGVTNHMCYFRLRIFYTYRDSTLYDTTIVPMYFAATIF